MKIRSQHNIFIRKGKQNSELRIPSWVFGPVLLVIPFFLIMLVIYYPRPLNYNYIPAPSISDKTINAYINKLHKNAEKIKMLDMDLYLIEAYKDYSIIEFQQYEKQKIYNTGHFEGKLRLKIRENIDKNGVKHFIELGDFLTSYFVRLIQSDLNDKKVKDEIIKLSGNFITRAKETGMIKDNILVAPIPVVASLYKIRWKTIGNLNTEFDFSLQDQIFYDIFKVKYGTKIPLKLRLISLNNICRQWENYPCKRTEAVVYKQHNQIAKAKQALMNQLEIDPFDIISRNFFIYLNN